MGLKLKIVQIKPNPIGKDRSRKSIFPYQVVGEWVDIRNDSGGSVFISPVELYHQAYDQSGKANTTLVTGFKGNLPAGQTMRVHSGKERQLSFEDQSGVNIHVFLGRDQYIWNNDKADRPALLDTHEKTWIDWADYDPWPPEGAILVRGGNKLLPAVLRYGNL